MIRDVFRVLKVDLTVRKGEILTVEGRDEVVGGSGLAAKLFGKFGDPARPWDDPGQPLIFAIGPLTGFFPLMSKTVCGFKSPYHDQYAESHAGGRSALSLRLADLDALVITGRAERPVCLSLGSRHLDIKDVSYLWGKDLHTTGKTLRRLHPGSGHRSIWRIGPAGENRSAMACINVDTYRHFGRLGAGAVMGSKRLKAIVVQGDGIFPLPEGKTYPALFQRIHDLLTETQMMHKYHNLGTPVNMAVLNGLSSLPIRNLQRTTDPDMDRISGERFADETLARHMACAGCPVGCIHVGFVREKFMEPNQYLYRQVSYDHEPIFAAGAMLGVDNPFEVLAIIDESEKAGLDIMSAGVALAWATEALEKGLVTEKETLVPLTFGHAGAFRTAMRHLGDGANPFYQVLAQGAAKAAQVYGGSDFACVLGQEMAGYATGEVFFTAQALGFRHSHLDSGGYSYDQKHEEKNVDAAVDFLVRDEADRVCLTNMVCCLFAREVYKPALLSECLESLGYKTLAGSLGETAERVRRMRWKLRMDTGFDPIGVRIPKRFTEIVTWKGPLDAAYLDSLRSAYAARIAAFGV